MRNRTSRRNVHNNTAAYLTYSISVSEDEAKSTGNLKALKHILRALLDFVIRFGPNPTRFHQRQSSTDITRMLFKMPSTSAEHHNAACGFLLAASSALTNTTITLHNREIVVSDCHSSGRPSLIRPRFFSTVAVSNGSVISDNSHRSCPWTPAPRISMRLVHASQQILRTVLSGKVCVKQVLVPALV